MLSTAYLGLIIFIIIVEFTRKKDTKFDFLSLFHLFFILLYPLPGYFIINFNTYNDQIINPEILRFANYSLHYNWQVPTAIFLTYFMIIVGYYSPSASKYATRVNIISKSDSTIWRLTIGILLLGWISILLYSSQYGGIAEAIYQANLIRSGAVEGQAFAFFIRLVYFNFFAAYLIASLLFIKKNNQRKSALWLLFILAISSSLIAAFMVSARATMILALVNFYLAYLLHKRKLALPILIPLLIIIVLFIVYGKLLFYSLSGASEGGYLEVMSRFREAALQSEKGSDILLSLIKVFSYGFVSLYAAFNEHYTLRLFSDWLYGFASYLPDRLIEVVIPPSVSTDNSLHLLGHNKYTIPTGFIASCVYSWSWVGVIIFSFSYGWLGRYLQTILQRHLYKICWIPFAYVAIAQAWSDFLASGDPEIFLQTNFWILASVFFLFFFGVNISLSQSK